MLFSLLIPVFVRVVRFHCIINVKHFYIWPISRNCLCKSIDLKTMTSVSSCSLLKSFFEEPEVHILRPSVHSVDSLWFTQRAAGSVHNTGGELSQQMRTNFLSMSVSKLYMQINMDTRFSSEILHHIPMQDATQSYPWLVSADTQLNPWHLPFQTPFFLLSVDFTF